MRTGVLLAGAVLASILAVDIPAADRAEERAYVPASERWIELGAEEASKEVSDPLAQTPGQRPS